MGVRRWVLGRGCRQRTRRRAFGVVALAAGVALLLTGCRSGVVRRSVQRRLEKRLAVWVGPAEEYRVRIIDTPDAELVLGRARRVEISGSEIHARGEFDVQSLDLTLSDLRYEGGEPDFISVNNSELTVEFTEGALNRYLQRTEARFQPEIELIPNLVRVRMTYSFLGKPIPLRATGRLVIQGGRRLLFQADSADVSFATSPEFARKFVEDRLNPLLDLSRIDFPARLESVEVLQGRLRARGSATLRKEVKD